ncbi:MULTISPECIES: DUF3592 domain-containing protein [unclassified Gordonia (in: high G+C Gram-positive bacteria)]|uniref:DUF3592 domain-containing protein n=1 Tax=unclassified Gordonia (in: high G+C Gram-positive bacteria) TaxID=2657482 RepID=UPI001FFEF3F2|nr:MULTISPECIES: DUF3592 domain-containing protein [unclassified Gordonia (in: high G+C Gram-positive bacteria)]UQE74567.1 DUF3592 domain-containing protein [Gordonia sp. PP30]
MNPVVQRRVQFFLLAGAIIATLVGTVIVLGAYRNDAKINANKATAVAEVISTDRLHAAVNFVTPDGVLRNPDLGLLYPTQLQAGQRILVDYDATDPDHLARPAGRDARLALLPGLSIVVAGWGVAIIAMVLVAQVSNRIRRRREGEPEPGSVREGDALSSEP